MKPKTETREYGDCMFRSQKTDIGTRYTILGKRDIICDFVIWNNGSRNEMSAYILSKFHHHG